MENFLDSYTLTWTLRDDEGNDKEEVHALLSMDDFHEIYGMESRQIVALDLRLIE